jgi:hypothetical protein
MQLIDEILEYLQYHPMSSRQAVRGWQQADEPPCVECPAARLRTLSAHVPLG